jgi:hypothetical protein
MDSNIIKKIDSITELTESQRDRNLLKERSSENLLNFLNGYMSRVSSKNDLKNKVEQMLLDKITTDEEDLPYGVLMRLYEIISKTEVESATPILKIIESATKQPDSPFNAPRIPEGEREDESSRITTEEYKSVKKLLKIIDDLENTEFPNDKNKE